MMKKIYIFVLSHIMVSYIFCQPSIYKRALEGGNINIKNFNIKVPIKISSGKLVLIPLNIDNTIAYFIFDTAAGTSVIDKDFYEKHKTEIIGKLNTYDGAGQKRELQVVNYDSCNIGNLMLTDIPFVVSSLDNDFNGISGILGANIINKLNWHINYDSNLLTVTDLPLEQSSIVSTISIGYDNNIPCATIKCGKDIIGNCIFDFGFSRGLGISKTTLRFFQNLDSTVFFKSIAYRTTLFGDSACDTIIHSNLKNKVTLGKFDVPDVEIYVYDSGNIILGQDFFSLYNIGIDSKNMSYILYSRKSQNENKDIDFPIGFKWQRNKLLVRSIALCSSADNDKIKLGDEVEEVNGKPISSFSNEQLFIEWLSNEEILKLKIKNSIMPIQLKKEKRVPISECEK